MSKIERFEDVLAWQKARLLARQVYAVTKAGAFVKDYGLKDQIQRAAVSAMSNIAEGYERRGDREFVQFLSLSKGSCGEVRSDLYVAMDQGYITSSKFDELYASSVEVSRLLAGFMAYLKGSHLRGPKYHESAR